MSSKLVSDREDNFHSIERKPLNSVDELHLEKTSELLSWWKSFGATPPTRSDFDIIKFPHLAPNIYLIEVISPTRFLYRLCGEEVGRLVGRAYRMVEMSPTSDVMEDRLLADYLIMLMDLKGPCTCRGSLKFFDRDFSLFESLDVPLMDEDGNITHFLGVLDEIKR
ncbi:PAS domain-containing protein [Sneathiella sp. P13V-1]|uniref:PAS domain-containing protein n=1 Tax=Sneathiella sp. P13V-1 TaxID=2697366 RepID=UPI001D0FF4BA|nr:PAS domain-containing protein [Sneathiella sp. P13V-1]